MIYEFMLSRLRKKKISALFVLANSCRSNGVLLNAEAKRNKFKLEINANFVFQHRFEMVRLLLKTETAGY